MECFDDGAKFAFRAYQEFPVVVTRAILISTAATLAVGATGAAAPVRTSVSSPLAEPRTGIYDNICAGQPAATRVQFFTDKFGTRFPVRCGVPYRWGYAKIAPKHGPWNQAFEGEIRKTITSPGNVETQGTSKAFLTKQLTSGIYFKVVVEYKKFSDGDSQGIITAFQGSVALQ